MSCAACGHTNPAGNRFCGSCGAALAANCPSCGHVNPPDHRFCGACGAALAPGKSASLVTAPPAHERSPRVYTPKHLADKILASRAALEGERKQVTVLFADVRGSLELAESVDPEQWHAILDRFFAILADGVHRFEGTVNQYTGDGIMALFGAPLAHEDHAQRACYAALHLRDALREFAREVKREHALDFATRIGLNSGDVVVGRIGDDLRMDYTAQGAVVGLAQRMESLASGGSIYLSAGTAALVAGYFALDDLGEVRVKGASEPVRVFELAGLGALRTRFDRSRARGLSRFAGRANEMATLEAALEQALAGRGQVVGVVADAGTGKSRLCFEFAERCRARGIAVRTTTGVSHGKAVPLLPVLDFYRSTFGITERDDARAARQKIAGAVVQNDESLVSALPLLFEFLGVPDPEKPVTLEPGPERQRALLAALKRLTLARSRREPAVIVFEDLHWIDEATGVFLENLVDATDASRTLLLVNFRPEYHADWMRRSYYQQLALAPLTAEAFDEMLGEALGADPSMGELAARVHERSGGNPFFAEEIVQALIEAGALAGAPGAYRLTRSAASLEIPPTVQLVLAARIDRLGEREKGVLQAASVIGREVPEALLRRVSGLDAEPLSAALRALVQGEFLHETALYPEAEYAFKHPLTQEVAYGSQLRERRARMHEAVARALEASVDPERPGEHAALLAHHYDEAGCALEAARWHRRAAEGLPYGQFAQAVHHWRRVRARASELPESRERSELITAGALGHIAQAARVSTPLEDTEAAYQEVIAEPGIGEVARAEIEIRYWFNWAFQTAHLGEAIERLEAACRTAAKTASPALRINAHHSLALVCLHAGRLDEALTEAHAGLGVLSELATPIALDFPFEGLLLTTIVSVHFQRGELDQVGHWGMRLREYNAARPESPLWNTERSEALAVGDGPLALRLASLDAERTLDSPNELARIGPLSALASAYLLCGHAREAAATAETALGLSKAPFLWRASMQATMAEALADHSPARAIEVAQDVVRWVDEGRLGPHHAAYASLTIARALLRRDGAAAAAEAERHLARAEAFGRERGGRWRLMPDLSRARAEVARAIGNVDESQRHLREAHRLYLAMGAHGHAARLAKELGM